jgi:hypothetical protein
MIRNCDIEPAMSSTNRSKAALGSVKSALRRQFRTPARYLSSSRNPVVPGIEIRSCDDKCLRAPRPLIIELVKLLKRAERDWRAREESNP